jgi:DNA polymerase (family X)
MSRMDKAEVAAILDEIATLLELQGENPFRARAYATASRAIAQLERNLADVVAAGELDQIAGIGETLRDKINTLVTTGALPFYDDLRAKTPPGLLAMLRLPGLGPKRIKLLYDDLGIDDLDKLKAAAESGKIAKLKGFGAKTQTNLLQGLAFLSEGAGRLRIDQALVIAEALLAGVRGAPGVQRMELCGSLRRRKETVGDIDILVSAADAGPIIERFVTLPQVQRVAGRGETKASVVVADFDGDSQRVVMNADLRVVRDAQFAFALNYFTGSKDHNVALRQRAIERGLKLNEYELAGPKKSIACKDEADLYAALDLDYIPPELREQTGEIEAAENHTLPALLEFKQLQGIFHCHTTASDGAATLTEMAEAARAHGYKYLGIADHSQSLGVANGLSPARVKQQRKEIAALNATQKGFHVFSGTECDILGDGTLDFDDDLLEGFDYVVASVHTLFNQPEEEMTRRIVRAVSHPRVTMLGHATGRLLLRREGYHVDLEAVLQAAAKHGTMIEINANPYRLDLDWVHCKRARQLGVQLVINPDAHSTGDYDFVRFGVDVARRGWLTKENVFNTKTLAQVTKALEKGKT